MRTQPSLRRKLGDRHDELLARWTNVSTGGWTTEASNELHHAIVGLSELSHRRQRYEIEERALDVEVYLSSFIDSDIKPDADQLDVLRRLIDALDLELQQALRQPDPRVATCGAAQPHQRRVSAIKEVFFLKQEIDAHASLSSALAAHRFGVRPFTNVAALLSALSKRAPSALLLEMGYVENLREIDRSLDTQTARQGRRTAIVVLAEDNGMAERLAAMQAGADAFIPTPIVDARVVERIEKLVSEGSSQPYKVLIVDDDRQQAKFCDAILRRKGIDTQIHESARDALAQVSEFNPDLIIVDLYMPNMNGLEFTAKIRDQANFITMPIVFLSGERDPQKRFDALSLGGTDFLSKPIRPNHLIAAVWSRLRYARDLNRYYPLPPDKNEQTGLYQLDSLLKHVQLIMDSAHTSRRAFLMYISLANSDELRQRYGISEILEIHQYLATLIDCQFDREAMLASYERLAFIALINNTTRALAEQLIERLLGQTKGRLTQFAQYTLPLPMSVGLCRLDLGLGQVDQAVRLAIGAGSKALQKGDSQWCFVAEEASTEQTTLLAQFLDSNADISKVQVLYQPVARLHGPDANQYRIGLQLKSPTCGHLDIDSLRHTLEPKLGQKLDRWLLKHAFTQSDTLKCPARDFRPQFPICVESLTTDDFTHFLQQTLRQAGSKPAQVTLVVNLDDMTMKAAAIRRSMDTMRKLGVRLCAGNVIGTKTQLQYLEHLPLTQVELDPQLLKARVEPESKSESFAQLLKSLRNLGLQVTMPGVNNATDMALLWKLEVDYARGSFVDASDSDEGTTQTRRPA